jgi:hypothetical protein
MTATDIEFSFEEAVRTIGLPPQRLERLIDEGRIPVTGEGIERRISRRAILDYMATVTSVGKVRGKKQAAAAE